LLSTVRRRVQDVKGPPRPEHNADHPQRDARFQPFAGAGIARYTVLSCSRIGETWGLVASVGDISTRVTAVADQLTLATLGEAVEALGAAHQLLVGAATGRNDAELLDLVNAFESAHRAVDDRLQEGVALRAAIRTYAESPDGPKAASPTAQSSASSQAPAPQRDAPPAPAPQTGGSVPAAPATFGWTNSFDYRETFFAANPETRGEVVVHHAVEQQVMRKFPNVVAPNEMHSLENLRGIPKGETNNEVHLSDIRKEWNRFYRPYLASGTKPSKDELLQFATKMDDKHGQRFNPPIR
jgi:hypothetical protein